MRKIARQTLRSVVDTESLAQSGRNNGRNNNLHGMRLCTAQMHRPSAIGQAIALGESPRAAAALPPPKRTTPGNRCIGKSVAERSAPGPLVAFAIPRSARPDARGGEWAATLIPPCKSLRAPEPGSSPHRPGLRADDACLHRPDRSGRELRIPAMRIPISSLHSAKWPLFTSNFSHVVAIRRMSGIVPIRNLRIRLCVYRGDKA